MKTKRSVTTSCFMMGFKNATKIVVSCIRTKWTFSQGIQNAKQVWLNTAKHWVDVVNFDGVTW